MITSAEFCAALTAHGIDFVSGVPCSYFAGPIDRLTREGRYLPSANEGIALATVAGATVAGSRAAVIAQNSGFGNLMNPLTSLLLTYEIPVLVFMSLRGWPDSGLDEPQHAVMGRATHTILDELGVPHLTLRARDTTVEPILNQAEKILASGNSVFVLTEKGAIEGCQPAIRNPTGGLTRMEAMRAMLPLLDGVPLVSTTGYTSRELFALTSSGSHFYMQGSMGHASAFALGVALRKSRSGPVVVFDGDGAALMHLGVFSTIGATAPCDLVHVVFDNAAYESTGLQATTARTTNFTEVAKATGYASTGTCTSRDQLVAALGAALTSTGPHLIVAPVGPRTEPAPPRATSSTAAGDVRRGFGNTLTAGNRTNSATVEPRSSTWEDDRDSAQQLAVLRGSGSVRNLSGILDVSGATRILVVATERAIARLENSVDLPQHSDHRLFSAFRSNPDLGDALAGCRVRDDWGPDLILGIGGGSALDVAKSIKVLPSDHAAALDCLHGRTENLRPRVPGPLVLVPTTAGTGAEATQFATLFHGDRKYSLDHPLLLANVVLVDPDLTTSCPAPVTTSCAFDAFCHAVESFWARGSTGRSRRLAAEALRGLVPLLGSGLENPTAADRQRLAAVGLLAGQAINITRTTAAHACAYRLTRRHGVPHGVACLLHLQWLYPYNRSNTAWCVDERGPAFVARRMSELDGLCDIDSADAALGFGRLLTDTGWSNRLQDYGLARSDLPDLAAEGIRSKARAGNNPVRLDEAQVLAALHRIY